MLSQSKNSDIEGRGDGEGRDISRLEKQTEVSCPETSFLLDTRSRDRTQTSLVHPHILTTDVVAGAQFPFPVLLGCSVQGRWLYQHTSWM